VRINSKYHDCTCLSETKGHGHTDRARGDSEGERASVELGSRTPK